MKGSRFFGYFLAGALALVLVLLSSQAVRASEGVVIHDAPNVGGYHVTVLASPNPIAVGKLKMLIRLAKPNLTGSESPVQRANILVEFYHVSGPGASKTESYVQRRDLQANEAEPGTYEVADSLQNEGVYRITLQINDGQQKVSSTFEITARPQPDEGLLSILLLALLPVLLGWMLWLYLRGSKPTTDTAQSEEKQEISV
jgi:hypothetical protein